MPRLRLGVVLPVPETAAPEIDGLRRALGDGALGRIPAHLTLVPPVNVPVSNLEDAFSLLHSAATDRAPIRATLGPPTTFWPVTPVVYLPVADDDLAAVTSVRDAVFRPPLSRPLTHDFVPHVTLADEVAPERIGPAVAALADYQVEVVFDRITILQEGAGHRWTPLFDAVLSGSWVVGRGGVELDLSVTPSADAASRQRAGLPPGLVVTARRQGSVVGLAECRVEASAPGRALLLDLAVVSSQRGQGIGSQLLAALAARAASDLGATELCALLAGDGPLTFLLHRGWTRRRSPCHPDPLVAARRDRYRWGGGPRWFGGPGSPLDGHRPTVEGQLNSTRLNSSSLDSRCQASMRRTVPERERVTSDCVLRPRSRS